jgi:hypothetical protein
MEQNLFQLIDDKKKIIGTTLNIEFNKTVIKNLSFLGYLQLLNTRYLIKS